MNQFTSLVMLLIFCSPLTQIHSADSTTTPAYDVEIALDSYALDWHVRNPINHTTNPEVAPEAPEATPSPASKSVDALWPTQSHDLFHTGRSQYSTANVMGNELWRVHPDDHSMFLNTALIGSDGTIYYGSAGVDHSLYAINPDGTRKWKYRADGNIWGTPAMAEDGTIVFTTWGGDGFTHAVKPDGTPLWKKKIGGPGSISSTTIAKDGTIYFGREDRNIYALYPNGTIKWFYPTQDIVSGSPAISDDGTIYIGSMDHTLYALNSNGTLKWKYQTGDEIKGSVTIALDGTLYVPSFDCYFHALTPNGTLLWKGYSGNHLAARGLALAEDGTIYIGTELLRAYYPNGMLKWQTDVQGGIEGTLPAVSADGTIYVTAGAAIVAVNPDGSIKWRKILSNEQISSSPSIGKNDTVYVGSQYHTNDIFATLHAFGPGEPKTIEILMPKPGHLYLFSINCGMTPYNITTILSSVTVTVQPSHPEEIDSVTFSFIGYEDTVTSPPYRWRINQRFRLFPYIEYLTVTGHYKGGTSWIETMPILYYHLF